MITRSPKPWPARWSRSAFTLDGLGGWFVVDVAGAPSNVVGLSLPLLRVLLADLGVGVADLWAAFANR